MIKLKSNKIISGGKLISGFVYIQDSTIADVSQEDRLADRVYDYTGFYICAGFIDMHTHGAGGHPFIGSTVQDVIAGCAYHLRHGTTCIVPTITAGEFPVMKQAVANIAQAMESGQAKNILGAHMEGPYLSKQQAGAQCPTFITPPVKSDYESIIAEFGSTIKRWTYAPENDPAGEFCRYLSEHGIIPSAGHTDAKYPDMLLAVENGCHLVTHLYSCTSTVTRDHGFRSLGVIESAYLMDEMYVEIIADGKHLPPELINLIIKIKGPDRVVLTTDSLAITGTDIKEGTMSGTDFLVEDGVCKLKDRSAFAGSIATADTLIRTLVFDCGIPVETAVKMLTEVPAKLLQVNKGNLAAGKDADIVIFDTQINPVDVFIGGNKL